MSGGMIVGTCDACGEASNWPSTGFRIPGNDASALVTAKFNSTMDSADELYADFKEAIQNLSALATAYTPVTIGEYSVPDSALHFTAFPAAPSMDFAFDTDFPAFITPPPGLQALPTIDLSYLTPGTPPSDINPDVNWTETEHSDEIYSTLITRLLADLVSGATGLDPTVEQAIWDRALARQTIEADKACTVAEQYFAARGFDLPPGAMAGRIAEITAENARNSTDLNAKIMIEQAELAQKNSQFVINTAKDLEAVLRDFTTKHNSLTLDYAKAEAANIVTTFAEHIKLYIAQMEAKKAYIDAQIANLTGVVEYNKGSVELYKGKVEAHRVYLEGKASKNAALASAAKAYADVYQSQVNAVAAENTSYVEAYKAQIQNADMHLKADIAKAEQQINAYRAENEVQERIAEALTNVVAQSLSAAWGAVNTTASISDQRSNSLSWQKSISETYSKALQAQHQQNIVEYHYFDDTPHE